MRALSKSDPTQRDSTLKMWANTVWEHSQKVSHTVWEHSKKVSQHSVRALSKSEPTQCESTIKKWANTVWEHSQKCVARVRSGEREWWGVSGGYDGVAIYVCVYMNTYLDTLSVYNKHIQYILVYSESSRHLTAPYLYSFLSSPCSIDPHGFSVFTHFLYFVTPAFSASKLSSPSFLPDFQALFVLLPWNFYQ